MLLSIFLFLGRCFAGAEGGSRLEQGSLNPDWERVRATEYAPRGRFHVLERTHGLAEIVERGVVVHVGAPPASKDDKPLVRALKKAYLVTAIAAISGEITTVIYSTIVINKLAETAVAPATSVVALIARDYQLEWLGANVCFLGGLFGFVGLLGIRAYLAFGPAFGRFGALLCGAVVTHGCSVVNAGIAAGDGSGVRHASNYLGLVARYVTLVVANAWRTRGPPRIISLLCVVGAAWTASAAARTKHGDDCPLAQ